MQECAELKEHKDDIGTTKTTVRESTKYFSTHYINMGKISFMHALGLSPRCKYVASMNREYTSKFLRSRLVCIGMGRTSRSAPDKFNCNIDVIKERSPVEVNPNAEKDVGNIESIEKSNGTVNSDVKVVDNKKERTNKNESKFGNSNTTIVAKDKKLSQDNYSAAMKMLSQYRQSSSEQSGNIEDFNVSFTDMSMEQRRYSSYGQIK